MNLKQELKATNVGNRVEGFSNSIWSDIVIGVISLLIGVIVSYVFYRLQRRDVASAEEERVKHARAELMELVENLIINKQSLTEHTITNLIAAAERAHTVELSNVIFPITILQDVGFALQRSRHLDVSQKAEYASRIDNTITGIIDNHEQLTLLPPIKLDKQIEEIQMAIRHNDNDRALSLLQTMNGEFAEAGSLASEVAALEVQERLTERQRTRYQLLVSLTVGLTSVLAVYLSLGDATGLVGEILESSRVLQILVVAVGLYIVALALLLWIRIQRRTRE